MPDADTMLQAFIGGGLVVAIAKLAEVWYRRRLPVAEARQIEAASQGNIADVATRAAESIRATMSAEIQSMTARHTIVVNDLEMRIQRLEEASVAKDARIRELEHDNDRLTRRVGELETRLAADEARLAADEKRLP